MTALATLAFGLGTLLNLAAAIVAMLFAAGGPRRLIDVCGGALAAGAGGYIVAQGARWAALEAFPLTTLADGLVAFIVISAAIAVPFLYRHRIAGLFCFVAPVLAVLSVVASGAALYGASSQAPGRLLTVPLALHAGTAFLAYALFFLATVMGAAYLLMASRLKRQAPKGRLLQRMPSLEQLDYALYRLLGLGTAAFLLAMAAGGIWVIAQRELLGPNWWLAPKVLLAWAAEIFFVALYGLRTFSGLRGPKLAGLVVGGFSSILLLYIVLSAAQLRTYQFWGGQV